MVEAMELENRLEDARQAKEERERKQAALETELTERAKANAAAIADAAAAADAIAQAESAAQLQRQVEIEQRRIAAEEQRRKATVEKAYQIPHPDYQHRARATSPAYVARGK